eukprot:TRINITY_DN1623_c0_g1_i1.p1 TRINITY_DN1623_c0_g1~~TRINITY_DN1623_c0_g1_i1.p1  ORF type:complete len:208 (-),score=15.14 TRINITY_DN1623_c0_g1_i1:934-1557(-)
MNTPRVVMQETRKAFKKITKNQDLQSAMQALCNLKGVGPAMASGEIWELLNTTYCMRAFIATAIQRVQAERNQSMVQIGVYFTLHELLYVHLVLLLSSSSRFIPPFLPPSLSPSLSLPVFNHQMLDTNANLLLFVGSFSLVKRGKFFPQLTNLVRINTPKAVVSETRKAFRKLPNLEQAVSTLSNLKGVGTTLASGDQDLTSTKRFV